MRFLSRLFLVFFITVGVSLAFSTSVFADNDTEGALCTISIDGTQLPLTPGTSGSPISPSGLNGSQGIYKVKVCGDGGQITGSGARVAIDTPGLGGWAEFTLIPDGQGCNIATATLDITSPTEMAFDVETTAGTPICRRVYGTLQGGDPQTQQLWDDSIALMCTFAVTPNSNITNSTPVTISTTNTAWFQGRKDNSVYGDFYKDPQGRLQEYQFVFMRGTDELNKSVIGDTQFTYSAGTLGIASYTYEIRQRERDTTGGTRLCGGSFTVGTPQDPGNNNPGNGGTGDTPAFILCNQVAGGTSGTDYQECIKCTSGGDLTDPNSQSYWTAFGCVQTSASGIVTSFVRIGMGIAGGFVLLTILYGAFLLTTSSGDPKRVGEGQEMITSAIMGLVFIIFSIVILRFIGVSILQIPGFGA